MKVEFSGRFYKDIEHIDNKKDKLRIAEVIEKCREANRLNEIMNVKKMTGFDVYYRIRVGEYRIGVEYAGNTLRFLRVLNMKEIYRVFP